MNGEMLYDFYMGGGELSDDELLLLVLWLKEKINEYEAANDTGRARWLADVLAIARSDREALAVAA